MFSLDKFDTNVINHGIVRGTPLLNHFAQHATKHPHLKIRRVHTCPGHWAVQFDDCRMVMLLDNVPESILSASSNDTSSVNLLSSLLTLNELKSASSTKSISNSSDVKVNEGRLGDNISLDQFKKGFSRLFNKSTGTQQQQSISSKKESSDNSESLHILSDGAQTNSVLCFGDFSDPFVTVFFNYQQTENSNHPVEISICALQQNGALVSWAFDEVLYLWGNHKQKFIHEKITHATFISSLQRLLYAVEQPEGGFSIFTYNMVTGTSQKILNYEHRIREIREGKNGVWIISDHNIEHISIHRSLSTCSLSATSIPCLLDNIAKAEEIEAISTHNSYYVAYTIVPGSKELLLLDIDCSVKLWSPASTQPRELKKRLSHFDDRIKLCRRVVDQCTSQSDLEGLKKLANQCRQSVSIEMLLVYSNLLAITDQDQIVAYEPKTCIKIGQLQLPNDIALDKEKLSNGTIAWSVYGPPNKCGLFCSSAIYVIKAAKISDQIRYTADSLTEFEGNRYKLADHNLFHAANTARAWGLQGVYLKLLLELIISDAEQSNKRKFLASYKDSPDHIEDIATKERILDELVTQLENPALVWTASKNLTEHKHILQQVAQFILHFPAPDSSFWRTEKRMELSNTLKQKLSKTGQNESLFWEQFLSNTAEKSKEDITSQEIFHKLTPLNMQLVPTLAKSLSLGKELVDKLEEPVIPESSSDESVKQEIKLAVNSLTDIELEDLARENPKEALRSLCSFCGLDEFVNIIENGEPTSHENSKSINGYEIPPITVKPILWDTVEFGFDELLLQYNPQLPLRPLSANMLYVHETQQFPVSNGCVYLELIIRLLFDTNHPQLVLVLVTLLVEQKIGQIRVELSAEERKLNSISHTIDPQLQKHQQQQYKKRIKHLKSLLEIDYASYFAKRSLDVLQNVYYTSDMSPFDNVRNSSAYNDGQLKTMSELLLWNSQIIEAIQLLLYQKKENEVLQILHKYVLERSNNEEVEYQNIKLSHEKQCELVHLLSQYCVENNISKPDSNNELWKFVWDLMPLGYNVFHFFKEFDRTPTQQPTEQPQQQQIAQTANKKDIFAAKESDSLHNLVSSLNKKFASSHKLF